MSSPTGIAGVFDRVADTYDAVGVPWFGPVAQGLVAELDVQPGERVLDIGCGRGAALLPLARAAGPTGHVLGVDLAPRMVELTKADFLDMPQVEVRVADATALELEPGSYDVVASSLVLFFMPDPPTALSRWVQLLVECGRLGVSTFGQQDERWQEIDALFMPYLPPAMLDARTSGRRGPFESDEGVAGLLNGAGLEGVHTSHRTIQAVFRDAEQLLDFTWSHGQRAMWDAIPREEHDSIRDQIRAAVERMSSDGNGFSFSQDVRYTLGRRPTRAS